MGQKILMPEPSRRVLLDGLLLAGPFLMYAASAAVLLSGDPFADAALLPGTGAPLQIAAFLVAAIAAFLLTHLIPGLPWVLCFFWDRERDRTFDLVAKSFLVTFGGSIALLTATKIISGVPVSRAAYIILLGGTTLAGALISSARGISPSQAIMLEPLNKSAFVLTLTWVILLAVCVWRPLVFGMYNGDGIEVFYLAQSLRSDILPTIAFSATAEIDPLEHWNVTLIPILNSFLRLPSQLLLGDTEFSTRFPVLCALFSLPAILGKFSSAFAYNRAVPASTHLVILTGLFSFAIYSVLVSRNPVIEPPDLSYGYHIHFVAFTFLSIYYLATDRPLLFALFAAAASLTRWHEFAYFLVPLAMLHAVLFGRSIKPILGALVGVGLVYGAQILAIWLRGDLGYNYDILKAEQAGRFFEAIALWLSGHRSPSLPWLELFFASSGLIATSVLFRNRVWRIDAFLGGSFLLLTLVVYVVASPLGREKLHYLYPAMLLPVCATAIYLLRCPHDWTGRAVCYLALALGVSSSFVVYSWRPELTEMREAARKTALVVADAERFLRSPARGRFHSTLDKNGLLARGLEYDLLWVHYIDKAERAGPQHSTVIADRHIGSACMRLLDQAGPYFLYARIPSKNC